LHDTNLVKKFNKVSSSCSGDEKFLLLQHKQRERIEFLAPAKKIAQFLAGLVLKHLQLIGLKKKSTLCSRTGIVYFSRIFFKKSGFFHQ
jgi:hypothetical protein